MRNRFMGTGESGFYPFRKLRICLSGFRYAVLYDFSVAYKLVVSVVITAIFGFLHAWVDFIILGLATTLWLVSEMFNTTTEALCNIIEPRKDARIRAIKDIAAAAAGLCTLVWLTVVIAEVIKLARALL
jgi:diacylglycerol kinase